MDIEKLKELEGITEQLYQDGNVPLTYCDDVLELIDEAIARQTTTCPDCGGSGVYREYDEYDRYTVHSCATCDGSGEVVSKNKGGNKMRITIKETGEIKKLCLNKVIFNGMWDKHRAEEEDYDFEKNAYSMTEDTFRWWEDYIAREEELSFREREYVGLHWTDYEVIRGLLFTKGEADTPLPLFSLFLSGKFPIFYTIYLEVLSDLQNAKCLILDDLDRMTKDNKNIIIMFPKENMCHEEIVETTKRHLENIYREKITETEFYEMYEQGLIKCGETTIVVLRKEV